jgi:selenocysteine lyase/cysteine desulfurase
VKILTKEGFFPDDLLKEIRSRFYNVESDRFTGERIWFESASGTLRLKTMVEALAEQSKLADQLGRANAGSRYCGQMLSKGIDDVRLFLGAGPSGKIMPAMSSTHAIFRAIRAVMASHPGTNVVATNLEHPSVYDSTRQFGQTYGTEWRVAKLDPVTGFVPLEAILEKVDKKTCLIGLVHGSNITGVVHDLKQLVTKAKKINPNVFVLADGVQYAPHSPIDAVDMGVDAYVFGPYKVLDRKSTRLNSSH